MSPAWQGTGEGGRTDWMAGRATLPHRLSCGRHPEHDLAAPVRLPFEHPVRADGLLQRQDLADPAPPELAFIEQVPDLGERGGGPVDQNEPGPAPAAVRPALVGLRPRRDEHAGAGPEDRQGTLLDL